MTPTSTPLHTDERAAISSGRWFSSLSPALRHDILRRVVVRRFEDGEIIGLRGEAASEWMVCARGVVEVCIDSADGRSRTIDFLGPGVWFGDTALLGDCPRTHDAYARGETSVACLSDAELRLTFDEHREFALAMLQLQARRTRWFMDVLHEESLCLRARVAAKLAKLAHQHSEPERVPGEVRIELRLRQEHLARWVGASRQRLNYELKQFERKGLIRQEGTCLIIQDEEALRLVAKSPDLSAC